jgi:hypothetical protein
MLGLHAISAAPISDIGMQIRIITVDTLTIDSLSSVRLQFIFADSPQNNTLYRAILTGAADGETDLVMGPSSFSFSDTLEGKRTVTVIVPKVTGLVDEIALRLNGSLMLQTAKAAYNQEPTLWETMTTVDFLRFDYQRGAMKQSTTLYGASVITNENPQTYQIDKIITENATDGQKYWRTEVIPGLRPGDSVEINGGTYAVERIQTAVTDTTAIMSIWEQAAG